MVEKQADSGTRINCGKNGPQHHPAQPRVYSARRAIIAAVTMHMALAGCGGSSYRYPDEMLASNAGGKGETAAHRVNLQEPAADEVAIVINNNAGFGTHAGMFVGTRLSDPAGNYAMARRGEPGWKGPTLHDYVEHQMVDGYRVQIFRFKLVPGDISIIDSRVANAGITVPLNCAAEVRDEVAGVGLFKAINPKGWLSPSALAEALLPLIEGPTAVGACVWPNGQPCRPTVDTPAVAKPALVNPVGVMPVVAGPRVATPGAANPEVTNP